MIQPEILLLVTVAGGLFTLGLACLTARSNLIKMVMGIEFCGKGVSLLFILGGYLIGDVAVSQTVVFTIIAIEAVVAGLALALIILMKRVWNTFESGKINHLAQGGGK
ncbi:MAG: NADH-quinone oxidoreductase subunit K [Methanoregula sp.]|jgi:NADH-quinone oxidoreductase subunit K|nr:NADH-quinone oxidoreductase subunit K [Methanoregula sp.]